MLHMVLVEMGDAERWVWVVSMAGGDLGYGVASCGLIIDLVGRSRSSIDLHGEGAWEML